MPAERRDLTPAQEVVVRVLIDAIIEDVLEERSTLGATVVNPRTDGEPEHEDEACR